MQDINEGKVGDVITSIKNTAVSAKSAVGDAVVNKLNNGVLYSDILKTLKEAMEAVKTLKNQKRGVIVIYGNNTLKVKPMNLLTGVIKRCGITSGAGLINIFTPSEAFDRSFGETQGQRNVKKTYINMFKYVLESFEKRVDKGTATEKDAGTSSKSNGQVTSALYTMSLKRLKDETTRICSNPAAYGLTLGINGQKVDPISLMIYLVYGTNVQYYNTSLKADLDTGIENLKKAQQLTKNQLEMLSLFRPNEVANSAEAFATELIASLAQKKPTILLVTESELQNLAEDVKVYFPQVFNINKDVKNFEATDQKYNLTDLKDKNQAGVATDSKNTKTNSTVNAQSSTTTASKETTTTEQDAVASNNSDVKESLTEAATGQNIQDIVYPAVQQVQAISNVGKALMFVLANSTKVTPIEVQHLAKKAATAAGISQIRFYTFSTMFKMGAEQNAESNKLKRALERAFQTPSVKRLVEDWQKLGLSTKELQTRIAESKANIVSLYFCAQATNYTALIKTLQTMGIQRMPEAQQIDAAFEHTNANTVEEKDLEPNFLYAIQHTSVPGICIVFESDLKKVQFDLSKYVETVAIPANVSEGLKQLDNKSLQESLKVEGCWKTLDKINDIEVNEAYMSRGELEKVREYITRECNIPRATIVLYPNGRFEMYNIDESLTQRIYRVLSRDPAISNLIRSSGKYDFGHFTSMGQPKQKYNISGIIDNTKIE